MTSNTFTKCTKYTIKELECYVANPDTCVEKIGWTDSISLLPKYLNNVGDGVKNYLTKKIGTYDRKIDGVILAFKNTKILSPLMAIRPNSVRIHMNVSSDFYIFKPVKGSVVGGTVQYASSNYLSAVIYRVFNVTIKLQSKVLLNIARGSEIKFIIKSYDMKSDLPYIEGELIDKTSKNDCIAINGMRTSSNDAVNRKPPAIKLEKTSDCRLNNKNHFQNGNTFEKEHVTSNNKKASKKDKKSHKKAKRNNKDDNMLTDEEMEHSIAAILKNFEKEISNANDSVHDSLPLKQSQELTSKVTDTSEKVILKKKKRSNRCSIETMKEALLNKFASNAELREDCVDSEIKKKKSKKRKKDSVRNNADDFEASIRSSLFKVAAEVEKETDAVPSSTNKQSRKSVRFDDTVTEASFSALDSSELMEISYSKSQQMSSTLKSRNDLMQ